MRARPCCCCAARARARGPPRSPSPVPAMPRLSISPKVSRAISTRSAIAASPAAGKHPACPGGRHEEPARATKSRRLNAGGPEQRTRKSAPHSTINIMGKTMVHVTGKPMRTDWPNAWALVRERLRRELGDPVFEAWIGPLNLEGFERDELRIGAAKPFVRNWVANHYVARIERAFKAEGAEPASLSIVMSAPQVGGGALAAPKAEMPAATVSYLPQRAVEEDGAKGLW